VSARKKTAVSGYWSAAARAERDRNSRANMVEQLIDASRSLRKRGGSQRVAEAEAWESKLQVRLLELSLVPPATGNTPEPYIRVEEGKRKGDFLIYGQAVQDLRRIAQIDGCSVREIFNRAIRRGLNSLAERELKEASK